MGDDSAARPRAWVTGASSGIGRAFAERFAREGYDTVLVARREERLRELAELLADETATSPEVMAADLTDAAALERVAESLAGDSRARVLVNNAGAASFGGFPGLDIGRELELVRLLVMPTVRLTHAALTPMLRAGEGTIIQVSSRAALQPHPKLATYSGAKAFVQSFTRALADGDEAPGVRWLTVCPGLTRTELVDKAGIDTQSVAPESWLEPVEVVDAAFRSLARGELVCVPSHGERGDWLRRVVPGAILRRVAGVLRRLARV